MVSRIILLFTLGLMASMTLPVTATPHSQVKPREFNSDNITPASSSILVLNTTGASILSAIVDSAAGYAYFGHSASPPQVFRVRLSDFTNVATSTSNTLKMRLSHLTLNQTLTPTPSNTTIILPPSHSVDSAVIDTASGYAYFGDSGCSLNIFCTPSPNVVVKVSLSDFSI